MHETSHAGAIWIRDDRHAIAVGVLVWTLVVLMIVPDGLDYSALHTAQAPTAGSPVTRMLWLGLLGFGSVVVLWRSGLAWLVLRWLNPFLPAFLIIALASVTWSIDPSLSIRRDIRFITFMMIALAFMVIGWHGRRLQSVIRPILTIMLGGSLLFGLLSPQLAIHQESSAELVGAWRGLTSHKNALGALSCIGLIFWFHAWLTGEVRPAVALFGTGLCAICLLLSRSSTSLVTAAFVLLFLFMFLRAPAGLRRYMPIAIITFVAMLLIYSMAILRLVPGLDVLLSPIVALTGKDLSFTGRSEIWAIIVEHIHFSPYLGTGYGAYWSPVPGSPSLEFLQRMNFYPGSAHNGYLEIVNDLGFVGLACLIGYLAAYIRQSLQLLAMDRQKAALCLALFLQQGITNLSETHWLSAMSVNCVIMMLATADLARAHLQRRLQLHFGDPTDSIYRSVSLHPVSAPISLAEHEAARWT
ncbi:O-antigen ligase family protein [Nevskia soli]|uniref:O-antigen ligase family protein n=1 Tax=Nevskia soli TaxID=418856 RepID=UPI0004A77603|nr:O-antigen ligase family protein [Nevskia soli]